MEQVERALSDLNCMRIGGLPQRLLMLPLYVADKTDTQVAIHTDTLNECGFVDDTIEAIAGRAIHTYHTEGAGGGHAPDIIKSQVK